MNDFIKKLTSPQEFIIIAGPCTIDNKSDLDGIGSALKELGINFLRGGAYKMRTSPHSFRGLGDKALEFLKEIGEKHGLATVSECTETDTVKIMNEYIDVFLIGTRNMHNYALLEKIALTGKPIILKRGMSATYREWLHAADYILNSGNFDLILCERGIRTFETHTRNTLDLSAIPAIKQLSKYPIIVDPSHSTGKREFVKCMSLAAVAAGANGLIIETHVQPEYSICDAEQTVSINELAEIVNSVNQIRSVLSI